MNHFSFYSPTEFVFGRGTEQQAGALCRAYGATRVLVVYGQGHVVRSGLLQQVTDELRQAGLACVTLGGVQPNPLDDKVYEGISLARREHVDFLLAVGGGSVIDTAKAIAAGVCYDGDFWDFYGLNVPVERALKVGVVLTIPAAGSEGSGNSVITRREGLVKVSLRTPKVLRPVFAVMNPELTFTLPPFQTACGIADMMAHIMERYFTNTPHCETTDRLCEGLLCAIIEQGRRVMDCPDDYDARANLMWSGTLAHNGVCGVGREEDWYSHFLEHEISALYDVAHGAGLAVVFPAWLTWMAHHHPQKVVQFACRVWGVRPASDDTATALEGVACLRRYWQGLGLPVTLAQLGIERPDVDTITDKLHRLKGPQVGSYVRLTPDNTREILQLMQG